MVNARGFFQPCKRFSAMMSALCQKQTLLHHNMLISRKQLSQAMTGVSYKKLSPAIITSGDA
ncbi:hypothetical protein FBY13_11228 [Pantoea sp. SJZ147]|nr:hypothetical protein FBY13_11228 [Pantoea sp. SJZ147]